MRIGHYGFATSRVRSIASGPDEAVRPRDRGADGFQHGRSSAASQQQAGIDGDNRLHQQQQADCGAARVHGGQQPTQHAHGRSRRQLLSRRASVNFQEDGLDSPGQGPSTSARRVRVFENIRLEFVQAPMYALIDNLFCSSHLFVLCEPESLHYGVWCQKPQTSQTVPSDGFLSLEGQCVQSVARQCCVCSH